MLSDFIREGLEKVTRLAFINGFPDDISVQWQHLSGREKITMTELIAQAYMLTQNTGQNAVIMATVEPHYIM